MASRALAGTGAAPAVLEISDGPTFDFGDRELGTGFTWSFTVTNTGEVAAVLGTLSTTELRISTPFRYAGGTCAAGGQIPPSGSCTLDIMFAPIVGVDASDQLELNYHDGATFQVTARPIEGTGVAWATAIQLGTSANDYGRAVTTDNDGNIYLTGYTLGNLGGQTNAGGTDGYILKLDSAGNVLWTRLIATPAQDFAWGVTVDINGDVLVVGHTFGNLDGSNAGGADLYVAKFDPDGVQLWIRQLGSVSSDLARGVVTDQAANVFVSGITSGGLDGNTNAGLYDLALVKYDSSGAKQWTNQIGTSSNDLSGFSSAIDSTGSVYITGYSATSFDGNPSNGLNDAVLVKYDNAGTLLWSRQLGTSTTDLSFGVATDTSDNVYITGHTQGILDGTSTAGAFDIYVAKYAADGTREWTRQLGTAGQDLALGIATDAAGNVFVTGFTAGDLDGNVNAGPYDLFLVEYDATGVKLLTRQLGTTFTDQGLGVAVDDVSGTVCVTGYTLGNLDGNVSAGQADLFLLIY
jgi:hypothetical protein